MPFSVRQKANHTVISAGAAGPNVYETYDAALDFAIRRGGVVTHATTGTYPVTQGLDVRRAGVRIEVPRGAVILAGDGPIGWIKNSNATNFSIVGSGLVQIRSPQPDQRIIELKDGVDPEVSGLAFEVSGAGSEANPHELVVFDNCTDQVFADTVVRPHRGTWISRHINGAGYKLTGNRISSKDPRYLTQSPDRRLLYRGWSIEDCKMGSISDCHARSLGDNGDFVDYILKVSTGESSPSGQETGHFTMSNCVFGNVNSRAAVQLLAVLSCTISGCEFCYMGVVAGHAPTAMGDAALVISGIAFPTNDRDDNGIQAFGCQGVTVTGCDFHNNASGEGAAVFIGNSTTTLLNGNTFSGQLASAAVRIHSGTGRSSVLTGNFFYRSGGAGTGPQAIDLGGPVTVGVSEGVGIVGNFHMNYTQLVNDSSGTPVSGTKVIAPNYDIG